MKSNWKIWWNGIPPLQEGPLAHNPQLSTTQPHPFINWFHQTLQIWFHQLISLGWFVGWAVEEQWRDMRTVAEREKMQINGKRWKSWLGWAGLSLWLVAVRLLPPITPHKSIPIHPPLREKKTSPRQLLRKETIQLLNSFTIKFYSFPAG